jgi:hypothetical protein
MNKGWRKRAVNTIASRKVTKSLTYNKVEATISTKR